MSTEIVNIQEKGVPPELDCHVWFTADTHFDHANILKYCNRPFKDVFEMNEAMIHNWNKVVNPSDTIYFLGDFAFGNERRIANYLRRLNGNIKILFGNHDKTLKKFAKTDIKSYFDLQNRIEFLGIYAEATVNDQFITLNHYAQVVWNKKHHGAWALCGHSHYNLPAIRKDGLDLGRILDVGVDGNDFAPYSFKSIQKIMDNKPIFPVSENLNDHHEKRP